MSKPSDEAVRKEFEAWARQLVADKAFNLTPCCNPSCGPKFHHYQFDSTNGAWASWQAAKSLYRSAAIQECADKLTDGSCCRYIDHAQDYCSCADIRSALETLKKKTND